MVTDTEIERHERSNHRSTVSEQKQTMNIYQRLNAVRAEVGYLQKDKEVQGYMVVTHDQVTAAVRGAFIKHGILVVPHQDRESRHEEVGKTTKGAPIIRYEAFYQVDFVNCDDPQDVVSVHQCAHALDHGDKAPGKACSYAVKYAILKVLSIETGEEEESRYNFGEPGTLSDDQADYITDLMEKSGDEDACFRKINKVCKLSVTRVSDLPETAYKPCVAILECEIAANENADSVVLIKEGIAENDMVKAAEAWDELDKETKQALWLATTKGGCFSTAERAAMKSDDFYKALHPSEPEAV